MEMIDLSRVIYDGMPKIPILPDVHVTKFLSLEKGAPVECHRAVDAVPCWHPCRCADPYHAQW